MLKPIEMFVVLMMALCLVVGGLAGGTSGRDAAINEVHQTLAPRCEAPAIYSKDMLGCVTIEK